MLDTIASSRSGPVGLPGARAARTCLVLVCCLVGLTPVHAQSPAPSPVASTAPTTGSTAALLLELLGLDRARNFAIPEGADPDGPVQAVYGALGRGSAGDTLGTARTFVRTYGKVLGFPEGEPLAGSTKQFMSWEGDAGRVLSFTPVSGKAEYISGMVVFGFTRDGELVAVVGRHKPLKGADSGSVTTAKAIELAKAKLQEEFPGQAISGDGTIQEYIADAMIGDGSVDRYSLVHLTVGDPPLPKRVVVHGAGVAMKPEDARQNDCDGEIFPRDPSADLAHTQERPLTDIIHPGSFWRSYTINGRYLTARTDVSDRASAFFCGFDPDPFPYNPPFAEVNCYYHMSEAHARAVAWGATEIDRFAPVIFNHWFLPRCSHIEDVAQENACEETQKNNAWYNIADGTMNFAAINPRYGGRHPGYDASVIYHEYGHLVHKRINEHWMLGGSIEEIKESMAVAEGFGDLFSASVSGNPILAKWYGGEEFMRNVEEKRLYKSVVPCSLERGAGSLKLKEVHEAGVCFAGAMWSLRTKLGDQNALMKTVIAGMRMARLPTTFRAASLAVLAADQMLSGATAHGRDIVATLKEWQLIEAEKRAP